MPESRAEVGEVGRPPSHYATEGGLQPFDVVDSFKLDFYEGNAIKYLLRWKKKGGVQDLLKARHYLDEIIARAENDKVPHRCPECSQSTWSQKWATVVCCRYCQLVFMTPRAKKMGFK